MGTLSATRLAMMAATALVFDQFYHVVAEAKIDLLVKRDGGGHICEKGFDAWHGSTSHIFGTPGVTRTRDTRFRNLYGYLQ